MSQLEISVRDGMVPRAAGQDFFTALHALDIDAIEIAIDPDGTLPQIVDADGTPLYTLDDGEALKARLAAENVRAVALLLGTDFSGPNAEEHVAWAIKSVRFAAQLGASAVRIDTATSADLPVETVRQNFVNAIRRVLEATADTGIVLGIENHGHISNDPAYLDSIFADVPDQRLGMTLDTGNFYWFGYPLEELYSILTHFAPRARHTHVKNINYPADLVNTRREIGWEYGTYCGPLDEGNISMKRVAEILTQAGYSNTLCIENESLGRYPEEERPEIIRRDAAELRNAQA
jgi:sugar phosphate isomerase/epimerase